MKKRGNQFDRYFYFNYFNISQIIYYFMLYFFHIYFNFTFLTPQQ